MAQQLPSEEEQRGEVGQVQSTVSLALGLGLEAASGPASLAVTGLGLEHGHFRAPLAGVLETAPGHRASQQAASLEP